MDAALVGLVVIIVVALAFDYTNGFHDAANAIAVAVSTKALTPRVALALAAVIGAIAWNLITWWFGLPSSSSHALIGGLVGAALAAAHSVQWMGVLDKVIIPMILSPLVGFGLGYLFMLGILWLFRKRNAHRTERGFRHAQILSSAAMAF